MPDPAPVQSQSGGAVDSSDTRAFARAQVRTRIADPARERGSAPGPPGSDAAIGEAVFLVVDLETTGLGAGAAITEIGAVRAARGRIVEEFQSMVNPGQPIPPRITSLTGITQSMVEAAEPIETVLPDFLEWSGLLGAEPPVLVAHNAPFDLGFLKRAARRCRTPWPKSGVVDTLALARLALPRPLVRDHRLATLASHFAVDPGGAHRALADARATWGVLKGLLGLVESAGVESIADLSACAAPVPSRRRSKAGLAKGLPASPGVYRFEDEAGAALYIGSATNLAGRVSSYFTAAEKRRSIGRMVELAAAVRTIETPTVLEARVLELREIHSRRPIFNRASTHQDSQHWLIAGGAGVDCVSALTPDQAAGALGPFGTRAHALLARDALLRALAAEDAPLARSRPLPGGVDGDLAAGLVGDSSILADRLCDLMSGACDAERFEDAALVRSELSAYLAGLDRRRRIVPLASARRAIWAIHRAEGGWELHASSWGSHLRSLITPPRTDPTPWVEELLAEEVAPRPGVLLAGTRWQETGVLAQSLDSPSSRLVHWDGELPRAESPFSPLRRTRLRELIAEAEALSPRVVR